MITAQTQVVNVAPRISQVKFGEVLLAALSPAFGESLAMYKAITVEGVDPAFLLACFKMESRYATDPNSIVVRYQTFNMGNCRSSRIGVTDTANDPVRGTYVRYKNWASGARDAAYRLVDANYTYAKAGAVTIGDIIKIWAPADDANDPAGYAQTVIALMNSWIGDTVMAAQAAPKPNITWVGSPNFWQGRWGEDVLAIVDHIMQGTLSSTNGWFNNTDSQVSATFGVGKLGQIVQYVSLSDSAWANGIVKQPDLSVNWLADFVRRGDNPNHCTVSIEHEGYTGDVMPEAQYQATLALHKWLISQFPKITVDRQGINGHYQIDLPDKRNCPGSGFPWARLISDLTAWKNAGGGAATMPDNVIMLNGHALGHGFLDFYNKNGGVKMFGLPTSDEYTNPDTGCTEQKFERYWMEYDPRETNPDWQIRGKIISPYIP